VPIDYLAYARARDKVDPNSLTYSTKERVGTFKKHMRHRPSSDDKLEDLDEPEGTLFEADKGVALMLLITKLQCERLKVGPHRPFSKFNQNAKDLTRRTSPVRDPNSPGLTPSARRGPSVRTSSSLMGQYSYLARLITASGGPWVNLCVM
jgi:hypothetical protein